MPLMKEVKKMSKKSQNKKKRFNPFMSLIRGIHKVLDKVIVTPISRIVYKFNKFLKKNTGVFEGLLNKPHSLIITSLVIALFAFLLVDSKALNIVETESEILSSQPVTVIYNEEKYVIEGIPEVVDIILMGRKSDLYLAKQLGEHKVVFDLSDYKTGEYTVKPKYNHSVESVQYKLDPSSVTVKISEKISKIKTLTYDLLNQEKLDSKLNVSEVNLETSEVYVKGSSETLDKVATVKALIDVSTLDLPEAGEFDIDSLPMVAYDENGKLVDNVEIVPSTAKAKIKVDSFYRDLPVNVVPKGVFATGYAIASTTSSVTNVRVYGDQNLVSNLTAISAEIDVDGMNADKKFNVTLTKPSGVRYMSENTTTIEVKVGREATRELTDVPVNAENVGSGLVAQAANQSDTTCTVILKGVQEVIDKINKESVRAYVDLSGYTASNTPYEVPIIVDGQNLTVTYTAKVKTIPINVKNQS